MATNQTVKSSIMTKKAKEVRTLVLFASKETQLAVVYYLKNRKFSSPKTEHLLGLHSKMLNTRKVGFSQQFVSNQYLTKSNIILEQKNLCLILRALSKEKVQRVFSIFVPQNLIALSCTTSLRAIWFIMPTLRHCRLTKRRKMNLRRIVFLVFHRHNLEQQRNQIER